MTGNAMHRSIVCRREDGDLDVIAALNNSGEHLSEQHFYQLHHLVLGFIAEKTGMFVEALHRQDLPDVVNDPDCPLATNHQSQP